MTGADCHRSRAAIHCGLRRAFAVMREPTPAATPQERVSMSCHESSRGNARSVKAQVEKVELAHSPALRQVNVV